MDIYIYIYTYILLDHSLQERPKLQESEPKA